MSDLGAETTTAILNFGSKSFDVVLQYLKFQAERSRMNNAKPSISTANAAKLLKSGDKVVSFTMNCTDQQMRDFAAHAKTYGLVYTSLSDKTQSGGNQTHVFCVKEKDLDIVKKITDKMTENISLKNIDNHEAEIKNKINVNKIDMKNLDDLAKRKIKIVNEVTASINKENTSNILKQAIYTDEVSTQGNIYNTLRNMTARNIPQDTPCYICDCQNSQKYIEVVYSKEKFRGEEYIKTTFNLYRDGKLQQNSVQPDYMFSELRFEGRPTNYTEHLYENIVKEGELSNYAIVLNSKNDLIQYQKSCKNAIQKSTIIENKNREFRDYAGIIDNLKSNLKELEATITDDKKGLIDLLNGETFSFKEDLRSAECAILYRQITNYTEMNMAKTAIEMNKVDLSAINKRLNEISENSQANDELLKIQETIQINLQATESKLIDCAVEELKLANISTCLMSVKAMSEIELKHGQNEISDSTEDIISEINETKDTVTLEKWSMAIDEKISKTEVVNNTVYKPLERG